MHHARHGGLGEGPRVSDAQAKAGTIVDPVSGRPLSGTAISCVYQGRAYYFESKDNRDAFETDPPKYLAASPMAGQAIGPGAGSQPRRRSGGCC